VKFDRKCRVGILCALLAVLGCPKHSSPARPSENLCAQTAVRDASLQIVLRSVPSRDDFNNVVRGAGAEVLYYDPEQMAAGVFVRNVDVSDSTSDSSRVRRALAVLRVAPFVRSAGVALVNCGS
jgi:hypothetical protein